MPTPRHRRSDPSTGVSLKRSLVIAVSALAALGAIAAGVWYMNGSTAGDQLPQAMAMLDKGDYRGAEIALKSTIQDQPANAEARYRLAHVLYKTERYPAAEKEIRAAMEKGARHPDLPLWLGRTLLRQGQADRLLQQVNPAADAAADMRAEILVLRAKALLLKGQREAAEQSLEQAELAAPGNAQVLAARAQRLFAAGQHEPALAKMDQALAADAGQAELWNTKGDLLRLLKRGQEARAAYAKASALEPQSMAPRLASISLLLEEGRLDQAGDELEQAKQIAGGQPMLLLLEAQLDTHQGRHAAAQDKLLQVLKVAPDYPPAQRLAGIVFLMTGQRENAVTQLNRYLEHAPKDDGARKLLATALLETRQVDRAREVIDQIADDAQHDPLLATLRGDLALYSGNLAQARQQHAQALSQSPDNPALLTQLAGRLLSSGDEAGALRALEKAAALEPGNENAALMLVMLNTQAKRFDQALKAIDALAKAQPKAPMAANLRGVVEMARGRNDQARQQFEAALGLDAAYLPAISNLAKLDLLGKDIKAARQRYDTLLKKTPNNGKALLALAELDLLERNEKAFLEHIDRAKRADPKDAAPRVLAARYWLGRRDTDKALDEARAGLEATGNPVFHELLGDLHLARGGKQEAVSHYAKWAESAPHNPLAHYHLALAQHATGDRVAAAKSLDKALQISPNSGEVTLAKVRLLIENGKLPDALALARDFQKRQPRSPLGIEAEARTRAAQGRHADAAVLWERAAQMTDQGRYAAQAFSAYKQAGQAARGEAYLTTWLNQHPKDLVVRHLLAQSQLQRGLDKEASASYELLLRQAPQDVVALNNLATLYGQAGDKRALATAEQALRLAPANPLVLDTYGWLLSESGQAKAGLAPLRKALAAQPDQPVIRWHLAVTLQRSGDLRGAMDELDRLLTSRTPFPQQAEARKLMEQLRATVR